MVAYNTVFDGLAPLLSPNVKRLRFLAPPLNIREFGRLSGWPVQKYVKVKLGP